MVEVALHKEKQAILVVLQGTWHGFEFLFPTGSKTYAFLFPGLLRQAFAQTRVGRVTFVPTIRLNATGPCSFDTH